MLKESIIFPGKKIVVVSHCILNQNAVVNGWERARGAYTIAKYILEKGVGLIQLPCPELLCMGLERAAMSYEDYNSIEGYRKRCLDLLEPVITQLKMYKESNYKYLGVIGINESPNCSISGKRGILMELYFEACERIGLSGKYMEIPTSYDEFNVGDLESEFDKFIEGEDV